MGALAQVTAEIRDEEPRFLSRKLESWQLRRPVLLIDWMLAELDELNLHGETEVPSPLMGSLRILLNLVDSIPGFSGNREGRTIDGSSSVLRVRDALFEGSILRFMDALFELRERLLQGGARRARCARRTGLDGSIQPFRVLAAS